MLGTDAERVRAAIERAMSPDGVLVLMDLGSALMSAEFAVELLEDATGPGAVERRAAGRGCRRGGGRPPAAVQRSTRSPPRRGGALAMKTAQIGEAEASPRTSTGRFPANVTAPAPDGADAAPS